ncbi:MAG: ubiquinone biosynthesis regulatory protein kinase UbiB [Betaproteobacteria bacterium TMED82]|nr:MAG: ubiquinone biosynthesis regulatory protein kinase UbiB [Betaproteobacteria bacterium TMED82]|tara:strand:+ start:41702 stop:43279 length:1578 start_codon:yes stop_codon:yes gene_type:complete
MNSIIRLLKICMVIRSFGIDQIIWKKKETPIFIKFVLSFLNLSRLFKKFPEARGIRLRKCLESLGPIFVKFGQLLSTRRDLLPEDIADELAYLQDRVKPFESEFAVKSIEKSFNKKLDEIFSVFCLESEASASIAQVHFGTLKNGREVAVKILRPKMLEAIKKDIQLLKLGANLIEIFFTDGKRLRPKDVVAEFDFYLHDELDLVIEASNASQLKRNFKNSKILQIPEMIWEYCSSDVIVMERVYGIPISRIDLLEKTGIDLKQLSYDGVQIFFTQVFRDGYFHADMHPGNILVSTQDDFFGKYIALDFGIVGTLTENDKSYLAKNFLAFFRRDYRKVAELHIESGWVPEHTRVESLESAVRAVCEPYFDKPLKDISLGQVLMRLFQASRRFNVRIQPQLVLLQKTLLNIEGLGRQLNPELDLWSTAKPFLETWMKEQIGFPALKNQFEREVESWATLIPRIPRLTSEALLQLKNTKTEKIELELAKISKVQRNLRLWLVLGTFFNLITVVAIILVSIYIMNLFL